MNGSPSTCSSGEVERFGKTMRMAMMKRSIPPVMESDGSEMLRTSRRNGPVKRKVRSTARAMSSSRMTTRFRLRGATFLRALRKTGMFPKGSRIRKSRMVEDSMSIYVLSRVASVESARRLYRGVQ